MQFRVELHPTDEASADMEFLESVAGESVHKDVWVSSADGGGFASVSTPFVLHKVFLVCEYVCVK